MAKKPPKPTDRPSNPRFKMGKSKVTMPGLQSAMRAVKALAFSDDPVTPADLGEITEESDKSERGAVLLLGSNLENTLRIAVLNKIGILEPDLRGSLHSGESSPLSTFSRKIIMGRAVKLFGPETHDNLDAIRVLRNAFAHSYLPITFKTRQIDKLCSLLKLPAPLGGMFRLPLHAIQQDARGLERFRRVCDVTRANLLLVTRPAGDFYVSDQTGAAILAPPMPQSLP